MIPSPVNATGRGGMSRPVSCYFVRSCPVTSLHESITSKQRVIADKYTAAVEIVRAGRFGVSRRPVTVHIQHPA